MSVRINTHTSGRCCGAAGSDSGSCCVGKRPFLPRRLPSSRHLSRGPYCRTGNLMSQKEAFLTSAHKNESQSAAVKISKVRTRSRDLKKNSVTNGLLKGEYDRLPCFGEFVHPVPDPFEPWKSFLFNTKTPEIINLLYLRFSRWNRSGLTSKWNPSM